MGKVGIIRASQLRCGANTQTLREKVVQLRLRRFLLVCWESRWSGNHLDCLLLGNFNHTITCRKEAKCCETLLRWPWEAGLQPEVKQEEIRHFQANGIE